MKRLSCYPHDPCWCRLPFPQPHTHKRTHTDDRYPPPRSLLFEHISSIMLPVELTTDLLSFFKRFVLDYWNGFNAILSNAFFWVWLETRLALFDCLPLLCSNRAPWLLIGWKHLSQCCEIRDDAWYMGGWYWWFLIYFPVDQYSVVVN